MEKYQSQLWSHEGVALVSFRWSLPVFTEEQTEEKAHYEAALAALSERIGGTVFEKRRSAYERDPDVKKRFTTRPAVLTFTVRRTAPHTYETVLTCKGRGAEQILCRTADEWDARWGTLLPPRKEKRRPPPRGRRRIGKKR